MTHLPDQTDYRYRALLAKYMCYHLTKMGHVVLPVRIKEQHMTCEEWDRLKVIALEVEQQAKATP